MILGFKRKVSKLLNNWKCMQLTDHEDLDFEQLYEVQNDLADIRRQAWDAAHKAFAILEKFPSNISAYLTAESAYRMLVN